MGELFEDEITDHALEGEIELLADVITAVRSCQGRLTGRALDEALGLVAGESVPGATAAARPDVTADVTDGQVACRAASASKFS
jgi:hypothetical protein